MQFGYEGNGDGLGGDLGVQRRTSGYGPTEAGSGSSVHSGGAALYQAAA